MENWKRTIRDMYADYFSRKRREGQDVTVQDFARHLDISLVYVWKIASGERKPSRLLVKLWTKENKIPVKPDGENPPLD